MSWSYDVAELSNNQLYQVRLQIGDTNSNDPQLQDEEINYYLSVESGNIYKACVMAVDALIAKYSRLTDKSVGDLHVSYSQRLAAYNALREYLQGRSDIKTAVPYAGGISQADKAQDQDNPDAVPPTFFRDQFSLPGTTAPNNQYDQRFLQE